MRFDKAKSRFETKVSFFQGNLRKQAWDIAHSRYIAPECVESLATFTCLVFSIGVPELGKPFVRLIQQVLKSISKLWVSAIMIDKYF